MTVSINEGKRVWGEEGIGISCSRGEKELADSPVYAVTSTQALAGEGSPHSKGTAEIQHTH